MGYVFDNQLDVLSAPKIFRIFKRAPRPARSQLIAFAKSGYISEGQASKTQL